MPDSRTRGGEDLDEAEQLEPASAVIRATLGGGLGRGLRRSLLVVEEVLDRDAVLREANADGLFRYGFGC